MEKTTIVISLIIFIVYFIVAELLLRKGNEAQSLQRGIADRGSTIAVGITFVLSFFVLASSLLFPFPLGKLPYTFFFEIFGIILMFIGFFVRIYAATTLGIFYTRTLTTAQNQHVVQKGLYKYLRHPGYFGVYIMWLGASLATGNIIVMMIILVVEFIGYSYRINTEEKMLETKFGEEYKKYKKKTYKLFPFLY